MAASDACATGTTLSSRQNSSISVGVTSGSIPSVLIFETCSKCFNTWDNCSANFLVSSADKESRANRATRDTSASEIIASLFFRLVLYQKMRRKQGGVALGDDGAGCYLPEPCRPA